MLITSKIFQKKIQNYADMSATNKCFFLLLTPSIISLYYRMFSWRICGRMLSISRETYKSISARTYYPLRSTLSLLTKKILWVTSQPSRFNFFLQILIIIRQKKITTPSHADMSAENIFTTALKANTSSPFPPSREYKKKSEFELLKLN